MDYKEQLEQLKTELSNAETPEQLSEAEFKIKKLKMQKELADLEATVVESHPSTVSELVDKYGLENREIIISEICSSTGLPSVVADQILDMYVDKGIDGDLSISSVSSSTIEEIVEEKKQHKKTRRKSKILLPGLVILAVLIVVLLVTYSRSGFINSYPDFANANSFESALNHGLNPAGMTVSVTATTVVPNSAFGYNIQAGEHLNFCSSSHPNVKAGDTILVEVIDVESVLGSYIIIYKKTNRFKIALHNISRRLSGY